MVKQFKKNFWWSKCHLLLPCKIRAIASIVLDIWYLWNSTVAQMRAWVPSFNLQHESSLYIVWLGHNLQKSLSDFREITPKIATACVNCSTKLFSWQYFWCLYCVEKKKEEQLLLFSQQLQATWGEDGEQNEKKGNGRFDCCQVAATAWCFLFNTLLKFALE